MSIYIGNMDMPTKENTVILITPQGDVWLIGNMPNEDTHLAKTKAVSVPKHGGLIDADSKTFPTLHRNPSNDYMKGWNACLRSVQQQPTIIPASEEE